LDVAAELQVLDDAGHRVGIDTEEPGQLADAGQGLIPLDATGLDRVLELLGQLPANGDRAVGVYPEIEGGYHCMSTLVQKPETVNPVLFVAVPRTEDAAMMPRDRLDYSPIEG